MIWKAALLTLLVPILPIHAERPSAPELHAFFSPQGGCTDAVIRVLHGARRSVLVQAYSFTSTPIAHALVGAKRRGVDVRVILDKSQRRERSSSAPFLVREGIPVWIDEIQKGSKGPFPRNGLAHNKVMVIDHSTVITGSFNFTKAAEKANEENLLIVSHDPQLAELYTAHWKRRLAHSLRYRPG